MDIVKFRQVVNIFLSSEFADWCMYIKPRTGVEAGNMLASVFDATHEYPVSRTSVFQKDGITIQGNGTQGSFWSFRIDNEDFTFVKGESSEVAYLTPVNVKNVFRIHYREQKSQFLDEMILELDVESVKAIVSTADKNTLIDKLDALFQGTRVTALMDFHYDEFTTVYINWEGKGIFLVGSSNSEPEWDASPPWFEGASGELKNVQEFTYLGEKNISEHAGVMLTD